MISVLLSGCGTSSQPQANASAPSASQTAESSAQSQGSQPQGKAPAQMNEQERQMMMTFQELLRMDKSDGLSITKEQAQAMLPVVQDSIAKKELSADAKGKLLEKLTADQKKFIDTAAANMQNRQDRSQLKMNEPGKPNASADGNGGSNGKGGGQAGPGNKNDQQGQGSKTDQAGQGNKGDHGGQGGNQERPGRNGGANAGQQLVELLQSKLK